MSDREMVLDFVSKLPEDTPMDEIARRIDFIAGIQMGLEQAERGEGIPAEEARALVAKCLSTAR